MVFKSRMVMAPQKGKAGYERGTAVQSTSGNAAIVWRADGEGFQAAMRRTRVKRVLITGMSGTGKSAVIGELLARGHRAVDLDTPEWSEWIDVDPSDTLSPRNGKDWVWQENQVRTLLATHNQGTLFISGCAENMERLFPLLDKIILLSAPVATIMKRLEARSSDGYGYTEEHRQKVRELIALIEPLLRKSADHEIDTTRPPHATVDEILRISYSRSSVRR